MRCPKCLHKLSNIKLLIAVCTVESIQKELQGDQELMIQKQFDIASMFLAIGQYIMATNNLHKYTF